MAVLGTRGGWKERSSPACPQTSADALRMGCKSRSEQGLCGTRMHRIKRKHKPNFLLKPPFFPCRPLPASMMPSDMRMATLHVRIVTDLRRTVNTTRARGAHVLHNGSAAAQDQSKRRPSSSWRDGNSYKHGPRPAHTSSMTAILALSPCRGMVRTTRQ